MARNPWRQGGSHYGEGARGDRREAVGGKTTDCGETANAVISFRLDSNEISEYMDEIIAYGTAVIIEPEQGVNRAVME